MNDEISMGDISKAILGVEARLNTTTGQLMQAIQSLDTKFTARFDQNDLRFNQIDSSFSQVDLRFNQIDSDIAEIHEALQVMATDTDRQIMIVRNQMVTRDYLDDKMGDLRGDMIARIRAGFPKLAIK